MYDIRYLQRVMLLFQLQQMCQEVSFRLFKANDVMAIAIASERATKARSLGVRRSQG
jgi:hypothetical protein